jgi:hypothetical protein
MKEKDFVDKTITLEDELVEVVRPVVLRVVTAPPFQTDKTVGPDWLFWAQTGKSRCAPGSSNAPKTGCPSKAGTQNQSSVPSKAADAPVRWASMIPCH